MARPRRLSRIAQTTGSWLLRFLIPPSAPPYDSRAFVSVLTGIRDTWGDFRDRYLRYEVFGAAYEGSLYKRLHPWSERFKEESGLYEYIRSIFSPAKRVVDFWASHTYGGPLDPEAGDGTDKKKPTSIPILTKNANLRPIIAQIFADSCWQANKDIYPRNGATYGDAFLAIVDDELRGKAYLRNVDPRTIYSTEKDPFGNIRGYTIVEARPDPRPLATGVAGYTLPPWVTYVEICSRDGEDVVYRTYLAELGSGIDSESDTFEWRTDAEGNILESDTPGEWREPYGFVPLYHVQNRDVGKGWGWSVYQGSWDKLKEIDDLGSKFHDHIRKAVDAYWYASGVTPDEMRDLNPALYDDGESDGKDDQGILHGPPNTSLQSMVGDLNVADVSAHIDKLKGTIAEDFPELMAEDVSPTSSAESRRVAREKVQAQVVQHRAPYDAVKVRAIQGAITILGIKGYKGGEGITKDSFANGELDFSIGDRPIFAVSEDDRLDQETKRSTIIKTLVDAGLPVEEACLLAGVPDETVERIVASKAKADAEAEQALREHQKTLMDMSGNQDNTEGNPADKGAKA